MTQESGTSGGVVVERLDHLVLTVRDMDASCAFYTGALGMTEERFAGDRRALRFGMQTINLHQLGHEFEPKAATPTPGSADLCFIVATPLDVVMDRLAAYGVALELGPVARTGVLGEIASVSVCDPDGNLIELPNYVL
ncbi:MAG: VOC family protein [Thermomicrobiales bacterium]